MKLRTSIALLAALPLLFVGDAAFAGYGPPDSYEAAQKMAASQGVPLLLNLEAEWSYSCKAFQKEWESDEEFRNAVSEGVVYHSMDAEEGEGEKVAKSYGVVGYPTFILANSSGETMDCWMGYKHRDKFLQAKAEALADPTTISEKMTRFRENPTEADAVKIGDLRQYLGYPAEAVAYYRRAMELNPESEIDYELRVLGAMARGAWSKIYTPAQVRGQADAVFASNPTPETMLSAYHTVWKVGYKAKTPEIAYPYLRVAYEALADADDEKSAKMRAKIYPDYALYIERDVDAAVQARKAQQPENWQEDGVLLNNFAWWCFENRINLEEAEEMARRGVELCEAGRDKANVLDTLAEICNLKDDCSNAVQYIRLAVQEDPENEYFQKQLVRFEEILAMSEGE
jgi:tetratricopeptide (TPR) repeat protein